MVGKLNLRVLHGGAATLHSIKVMQPKQVSIKSLTRLPSYVCAHIQNLTKYNPFAGMWWCSRLRHCATSQKVVCSIPSGVTGIFHSHNPSGHTMALGSTQPLTRMSTRNISWGAGKGCRCIGLTTLQPSCANCLEIWEPQPSGTLRACLGLQWDSFTFFFIMPLIFCP
jgi:hypothetical protein